MSPGKIRIAFDEARIDAVFGRVDQCQLPGAAVGIAIEGTPVYRKGFGLASMELPVVLSTTIRMRIASTTKHFTCFAYMLLCEQGIAGIDDSIGEYVPELHPVARGVTMRQLMGNTSGLRDVYEICDQFCGGLGQSISSDEILSLYRDIDDVNATPGTAWIYNNGGWLLLSVAIERLSGQPFEQVMSQSIFDPLGLHDTRVRRLDSDFLSNSATQHAKTSAGDFQRLYWGKDNLVGAGAMVSTVDDLLRWLAHMDAPRLGSAATWAAMKEPQRLANGVSTGYGLGLMRGPYRGVEIIHHAGNALGGNAQMLKVPGAGLDVVVISNRQDVQSMLLANDILDAVLPGLEPIAQVSSGSVATGVFRSPTTGRVIQLFGKDGAQIVSIGGIDIPFEPDGEGVLRPIAVFSYIRQSVKLSGDPLQPGSILHTDFGTLDELLRVDPGKAADAGKIVGHYRSKAVQVEATITGSDAGPRLRTVGRLGSTTYALAPLAEGIWRTKPGRLEFLGGLLDFDPEYEAFRFSNYQTRPLLFRRID